MYGGILSVLEELKVKTVLISKQFQQSENYSKFKEITNRKKILVVEVKKGDIIKIEENLQIRILFPTEDIITENVLNNNAMVARLEYNEFKMLFTGDIEKKAEEKGTRFQKKDENQKRQERPQEKKRQRP